MKKILIFIASSILLINCSGPKIADIEFKSKQHVFLVPQGQLYKAKFQFKNVGTDTLKIFSADGDCGCTKIKFPSETIQPGDSAAIEFEYDHSLDRDTIISKNIVIHANTKPALHTLTIIGNVKRL